MKTPALPEQGKLETPYSIGGEGATGKKDCELVHQSLGSVAQWLDERERKDVFERKGRKGKHDERLTG